MLRRSLLHRTLKPHLATERAEHPANPKSFLQECVQADGHEPPAYKLVGSEGPAHAPTFTAVVLIDGIRQGRGSGVLKEGSRGSRRDSKRSTAWVTPPTA